MSVVLNAMRGREAGLTAMLWSFASHVVSRGKTNIAFAGRSSFSNWRAKFPGAGKAETGEVTFPLMTT